MILGKLLLNEAQTIDFDLNVFGTSDAPSSIRFIIESDDFDIACKCRYANGTVEVNIPELKGVLEAKEYPARLEVIIGDKIFVPLKESIEFNPLVEFGVEKKSIKLKQESVEVKIKSGTSKANIGPQLSEGCTVKVINGFEVIMSGDRYKGFVLNGAIVESKESYNTLADLVKSLEK